VTIFLKDRDIVSEFTREAQRMCIVYMGLKYLAK